MRYAAADLFALMFLFSNPIRMVIAAIYLALGQPRIVPPWRSIGVGEQNAKELPKSVWRM